MYATGSKPTPSSPGDLGPIDEQHQEEYEYGEFIIPTREFVPGEVQSPQGLDHSVAGMSDITSDPGY